MQTYRTILILFSLILSSLTFSQERNLRAYMDNKQFYSPESGNYIEIYFQFVGTSFTYIGVEGGLQSELAVAVQIKEGDSIVKEDAYRLLSPVMKDSIVDDFYDVKRIALNPGRYSLHIELLDLKSDNPPIKASQLIVIEELSDAISVSDIEAIEYAHKGDENSVFFKSGYEMIPRLSTFYPNVLSSIPVYLEFYNTHGLTDSICGVKEYIVNTETGAELTDFTNFMRKNTAEVLPILRNVNIATLPSGTYTLNYTLISKSSIELTTQSYIFERSNDLEQEIDLENLVLDPAFQASITDDSVSYYLESLIPISKSAEIKNILLTLKTKDSEKQRRHIQVFWLKTSPTATYDAWLKYKVQVQLVEKLYSNNFQEGFETDRGRVYLQYGSPTNINIRENSPTEYPYEIWVYNKIGIFSNKRFIFYNPDLVNNTHRLLHSDMVGELKNPSWPQVLAKRNTLKGNIDDPNYYNQDHFGGASNDLYRQY